MAVSLRDVAEKAGVSGATVSRVLNGKDVDRIPSQTRERIIKIAEELDYRPNRFARSLRDGRTRTVGLMVSGLANPFFVMVLEAAERCLISRDYHVVYDAAPSVRGTYGHHAKLQDWPIDGVILWALPEQTAEMFVGSRASGMPVVYLGYEREDSDCVFYDYYDAAAALVRYLIGRGHRSIGYIAPQDYRAPGMYEGRNAALHDVCAQLGAEPHYFVLRSNEETRAAGLDAGLSIAALPPAERPRALFCHNDVIACGVYHGLRRAGLRIPEDVAVAGFDGIEEGQCLDLPLTTVVISAEELTAAATELLLTRIGPGASCPPQKRKICGRILVGQTT